MIKIYNKDSAKWLKKLPDNSVDSLVTDPPAGIAFMGKEWDDFNEIKETKSQVVHGMNAGVSFSKSVKNRQSFIDVMTTIFTECLRVLKPGGHGLVWALPRTSHWTATALENAGFEVRDIITHVFGSGFPKSHNIEKASDGYCGIGQGTALKPASEHWILVRKPLEESTVAKQVLKTGTGGINIDACRIGCETITINGQGNDNLFHGDFSGKIDNNIRQGRFPANFVMSCSCETDGYIEEKVSTHANGSGCTGDKGIYGHFDNIDGGNERTIKTQVHQPGCVCYELDKQSGMSKSAKAGVHTRKKPMNRWNCIGKWDGRHTLCKNVKSEGIEYGGEGGASRFFYCAKISTKERNVGKCKNNHPTVKPMKLMTYLIKLITPPGGTVLDPFMGSGSTMLACKSAGFSGIGIEKEKDYVKIAKLRLKGLK